MPTSVSVLDTLQPAISKIFDQAQLTTANHQKNYVALYKIHAEAAKYTEPVQKGKSVKLTGERAFEDVFIYMVTRVLPLKRGTTTADRIIKFVGGYTKFSNDKNIEDKKALGSEYEDEDTAASRFIARLLKYLLEGCLAKDKIVRYRVVQCIAEMISHLGEIDEELYDKLRTSLIERVRDKEPAIRTQALIALSKIFGSEDPSELEDDEPSILDVMHDALVYDTSADVRRAALTCLPPTPPTLSMLLSRTRDVDTSVRKLVYPLFDRYCMPEEGSGIGVTHPRVLTISQREMIVRNGLGDREEAVRDAASKLLGTWVDVVRVGVKSDQEEGILGDLIAFLKLFDLTEGSIAEDALLSVFTNRVDIFDNVQFDDAYWDSLTPEKSFLVRVFVDHCTTKGDNRIETVLPVVTALAFRIQGSYNDLLRKIEAEEEDRMLQEGIPVTEQDEDERVKREEERMDQEFVIGEMLKMALKLDYGDEIGRRKMFQLVRDMISQDVLPESLLARCLDMLRALSPNERDLIRMIVEVVHELRDPDQEEESRELNASGDASEIGETPRSVRTVRAPSKVPDEMTLEEKAHADSLDLRCLSLCIGMLERVNSTFEDHSTLTGILGELIIPAVKRKELLLRERGLVSLGLCCLIAQRMAINSFQLFMGQIQTAPEVLKVRVLQIVFDILMVHDAHFLGSNSPNGDRIVEFLLQLLQTETSEKVQSTLCMGLSKLMLSGIIANNQVLQALILLYVSPETSMNQELQQSLSYFFPVYCYSSTANQRRMQQIFIPVFERVTEVYKEWDGDNEMVTPAQLGLMFVDWTDPSKAVAATKGANEDAANSTLHVDMAVDMLKALYGKAMEKDDKKALCQLLGKLFIPDAIDDDKLRTLKLLLHNLLQRRPLRDTVAKNAFVKFDGAISKKFEKQLEGFSEEEYRQLESLHELFEWLDDIIPEDDDDEVELPKRTRKRRSDSVLTESTVSRASGYDSSAPSVASTGKGRRKSKKPRLSRSDESESDHDDGPSAHSTGTRQPTRAMPKRATAEKTRKAVAKAVAPSLDDDDDDEDEDDEDNEGEEDEEDVMPPPSKSRRSATHSKAKLAAIDAEIDHLLDEGPSLDSIMDESEDDNEVDDLL